LANDASALELLLRLSTIEGFSVRHLRQLAGGVPRTLPGTAPGERPGMLERGCEAAVSRAAGEQADRIREACERGGIRIIAAGSADYPPLLGTIPDAPLVLFWLGNRWEGEKGVAVVGSRAPTPAGKGFARELSGDLAAGGLTVVSGMARGIDAAAHEGALEGGGMTVAVLGCGVDVVYPPEAGRLRDRIVAQGAVASEYAPGAEPLSWRFPARNRIVSGMCRATVVAEAPLRSGALITVRAALEQGRDVLAVPGNPFYPHTAGSNRLLRDGAPPVTCAGDVLLAMGRQPGPDPSTPEGRVLRFLRKPRHVDEIAGGLRIAPAELLPLLLRMKQANLIGKKPGNYYIKVSV
jgi:DNA processing protein